MTMVVREMVTIKTLRVKKKSNHHPVPQEYKKKGLPGFPGSKLLPRKNGARDAWDLGKTHPGGDVDETIPKGWWGEWDSQHGEVEIYNKQGEHQGARNPETGDEIPNSQVKGRKPSYNSFSSEEPDAETMPIMSSPAGGGVNSGLVQKIQTATGFTGIALWIYIVVSEGSRLYPPRNFVPIP